MADNVTRIAEMLRTASSSKPDERWPALIDVTEAANAVPPFPVGLLPPPFDAFVADVADRMQVAGDFVAIPLLISAATTLGRRLLMAPKRHDDWVERACLWGCIIASPATLKTPAAREATRAIRRMHADEHDMFRIRHAEWVRRSKAGEVGPDDEPEFEGLIVSEATVEGLAKLFARNPRTTMLYRDELSGWFGSMNKYRSHGGDDRQFFLECWSGGDYTVLRAGKPAMYVDDLYLSIFGTIQPEVMRRSFSGGDEDGMTARFGLMAHPDPPRSVAAVDRLPDLAARDAVELRLREMRRISRDKPLRFDGMAYYLFNEWFLKNGNRPARRDGGGFAAHLAKYPALFARLSLTLHFMRHGAKAADEIDVETASAVRAMIDGYLEPHAHKIYGVLSAHPARAGAVRIATWIRDRRVETFTERDVRRHDWAEFGKERDAIAIDAAMKLLEAYGWIRIRERATTVRGGRPTHEAIVNPAAIDKTPA
jgi:putative DNA primase/helicase